MGMAVLDIISFCRKKMGEALAHLHHCLEELTLLGDKRFKQFDPKIRQGIWVSDTIHEATAN